MSFDPKPYKAAGCSDDDLRVLRWLDRPGRELGEARSRWGHLFEAVEDKGLVEYGERYVVVRQRRRWLIEPVSAKSATPHSGTGRAV